MPPPVQTPVNGAPAPSGKPNTSPAKTFRDVRPITEPGPITVLESSEERDLVDGPDHPFAERRCRICGCTELRACTIACANNTSRSCGWATGELCDNPECLRADGIERVVIYSGEHRAFWRERAAGYTQRIWQAGVWPLEAAISRTAHLDAGKACHLVPAPQPTLSLSCPDPLFDSKHPIDVNGYRYVPLDSAANFVGSYGKGLESFHSTAPAFVAGAAEALRNWGGEPDG